MGIFSTILGSGDTIKQAFALADNMHTSDAERIEATTKAKTDIMKSYEPFKVAQRYLALIFSATFVLSYLLVLVMVALGADATDIRGVIVEFKIAFIMLMIVTFYFGSGAVEGVIHKVRGK